MEVTDVGKQDHPKQLAIKFFQ